MSIFEYFYLWVFKWFVDKKDTNIVQLDDEDDVDDIDFESYEIGDKDDEDEDEEWLR